MDLDGDGTNDVITGSWPGELYFFKGRGQGKYAKMEKIKDKDGKEIKLGSASTVDACDWRGTGKLDLLVGCIEGVVWLVPNDGTKEKPAWGKAVKLQADGKEIRVPHGDSHPILADWEKSGKPGLMVGCGDGAVQWYRNTGTRKEPKLAAPVTLVAAPPQTDWQKPKPTKDAPRGSRAKVCVVDWNGDGHLDLLVGDFSMTFGEKPKMTDQDKKEEKEVRDKLQAMQKELQPFFNELSKVHQEYQKATGDAKKDLEKKMQEVQKKYEKQLKEQGELYGKVRKFERPYHHHGQVWLFLRKPAAVSSAPR